MWSLLVLHIWVACRTPECCLSSPDSMLFSIKRSEWWRVGRTVESVIKCLWAKSVFTAVTTFHSSHTVYFSQSQLFSVYSSQQSLLFTAVTQYTFHKGSDVRYTLQWCTVYPSQQSLLFTAVTRYTFHSSHTVYFSQSQWCTVYFSQQSLCRLSGKYMRSHWLFNCAVRIWKTPFVG